MNQTLVLGGLLTLALVGSYLTWTQDEEVAERKATDVLVYKADADAISSVTWSDEDRVVRLTRPSDASGAYVWIEQTDKTKVVPPTEAEAEATPAEGAEAEAAPAEGEEAAPEVAPTEEPKPEVDAPAPVVEEKVTRFSGNEQAVETWAALAPLYAMRELTISPDTDLAAFGLDAPTAKLTIELRDRTVEIEIGGESYGTRNRYARAEGRVYLLDDGLVRPLQFAKSRLVERRLHPFEEQDILGVEVSRGTETRGFVQKNADDRTKSYWADVTVPERRDIEGATWLGKLFRLRVKGYVDESAAPAELAPVFAFAVKGREGSWTVEVLRAEVEGEVTYYAKSSFTRGLVDLTRSLADEAIADLDALFDGVSPEPEEGEAPAEDAEAAEPVEAPVEAPVEE